MNFQRFRIHRSVVRIKLIEDGVNGFEYENPGYPKLSRKRDELRANGLSYHIIAEKLNALSIQTRTKSGRWYGKTVRDPLI